MKHLETHPEYVEGCIVCKATTVAISAVATPTSKPVVAGQVAMEDRWGKDIPAYRRLVKDGIQPKGIDGCAALEARANTAVEVERGSLLPKKIAEEVGVAG